MNKITKWISLIVILGAFPILCRIFIYYFPTTDSMTFPCFSLTDLLFYGITLHVSVIYELLNLKKDNAWNTSAIIISFSFLVMYIIYSTLTIVTETKIESFKAIYFLIPTSIVFSIFCYYHTIPKEDDC